MQNILNRGPIHKEFSNFFTMSFFFFFFFFFFFLWVVGSGGAILNLGTLMKIVLLCLILYSHKCKSPFKTQDV